jgi:hypothetical protein
MKNIDAIVVAVRGRFPDLVSATRRIFTDGRYDLLIIIMARILDTFDTDRMLAADIGYDNGSELLFRFVFYCAEKDGLTVSGAVIENIELYCHELWKVWRNDLLASNLARRRRSRIS